VPRFAGLLTALPPMWPLPPWPLFRIPADDDDGDDDDADDDDEDDDGGGGDDGDDDFTFRSQTECELPG